VLSIFKAPSAIVPLAADGKVIGLIVQKLFSGQSGIAQSFAAIPLDVK